ncbi:AMP-binding protein [Mangrovibacterium diazotrophicum]|uniref:Acetyl-CoA synthetase n=1 Tax=Mangrovibacterium diazotrophicum TaxID=1261403 RepID=A0A419W3E6_9BACT|nr:AMP-binding protein [Mangrovibacterium diazotrophicum]RKD90011.1 acetyl-CoA synthetase [Mangrovibacterium diazotrophicum]
MIEKYLPQTTFTDFEDFKANYQLNIPVDFNFAYDVVDGWAEKEPNKRALLWTNDQGESRTYTFGDLKEITDRTAGYFSSLGIQKGDMVMAILKRRAEFWFTIIALHKIGAVIIPATHLLTSKDIIYRANAASIKAIICDGDDVILHHVNSAMPESPTVEKLISIGPNIPARWEDFQSGIKKAQPFERPEEPTKNEDPIIVSFTSGTTGDPKMVTLDSVYPLAHIVTAKYWQNLHEDSLHLTIADTGWLKAVWGKLYGQWLVGASVFVYDHEKFTPSAILEVLSKYQVTSLCAPPTIFRFLIREDLSKYDLSALEWCTIAGEALNPEVYDKFLALTGIKLREGYGQSETTLTIFTSPWVKPKPGSMGLPNPHYDIDLLTAEGHRAQAGEQGQIVIRYGDKYPSGLFNGYYRNKRLTNEVMVDGIYFTGDLAWRDEDGYFWFVGRADDVIKSSGYRIGPFEVESALMTHPDVVECAITGVPDEIRGQIVKATVVLAADCKHKAGPELAKELQDHVKQVTAPYKYPRIIEFVDELPKTISGKIRRVEIRAKDFI